MTDIQKQIDELKALEAKATKGPWEVSHNNVWCKEGDHLTICDSRLIPGSYSSTEYGVNANADLIAALRNTALPIIAEQDAELARLQTLPEKIKYIQLEISQQIKVFEESNDTPGTYNHGWANGALKELRTIHDQLEEALK